MLIGRWAPLLLAGGLWLAPALARADEREEARASYEEGTAAYEAKDYGRAASAFGRADDLVPSDVALGMALDSAAKADDAVVGMELVERAEQRGAGLGERAAALRSKFIGRVGRLTVVCPPPGGCTARVAGRELTPGTRHWLPAGAHAVEVVSAGKTELHAVRILAGESSELRPAAPAPAPSSSTTPPPPPPPPPDAPDEESDGLHPAWFWVGTGVTAVFGGLTIGFGVDTLAKKDAFDEAPNVDTDEDGRAAQTRTNVLLGVTGALALGTAAVGIFAVDW